MKIAIVNDLKLAQEILKMSLENQKNIEIIWTAWDGKQAVDKAKKDKPDIILMDLVMPHMDGVEATRLIMKESPCAILIVTSSIESNNDKVYQAMGHGALDAVCTPTFDEEGQLEGKSVLISKIKNIINIITKTDPIESVLPKKVPPNISFKPTGDESIIAIGASTGGPQVLVEILSLLPKNLPVPILVVQHVDENFAEGFAKWLSRFTTLNVEIAKNNTLIQKGCVYIASTEDHMILEEDNRLKYVKEPIETVYRPSIDVLFKNLAKNYSRKGIAILLTGMGQDGADGILSLKKKGWLTIAQNKESCIVYGMPKAAFDLNAAVCILNPQEISQVIIDVLSKVYS